MKLKDETARRSVCPVACTLDILGDRWTLLVVRDLLLGRQRFQEFQASPEGIASNILADRLKRLCDAGIAVCSEDPDDARRMLYRLTPKGRALRRVLGEVVKWGLKYVPGTSAHLRRTAYEQQH